MVSEKKRETQKERWRVKALRKAPRMEMNWVGSRAMVENFH